MRERSRLSSASSASEPTGAGRSARTLTSAFDGVEPEADADMAHHIPIEHALDLHAFAPRDIRSVVEEYVRAAHEAGLREVRLIHGRGKGVQRGIVQRVLEAHPLVEEFWDATETHLGATVARLSSHDRSRTGESPS